MLGIVVGIEEKRRDSGHIKYKIKCADCGEIHIRSASQLKNGRKSRQCDNFKPHNKLLNNSIIYLITKIQVNQNYNSQI